MRLITCASRLRDWAPSKSEAPFPRRRKGETVEPAVTVSLINLSITFAGIFLCLLGFFQVKMIPLVSPQTDRYFRLFYEVLLLFALSNLTGQLFRGHPGPFVRGILILSNFLEMTGSCLAAYVASRFFLSQMDPKKENKRLWNIPLLFLAAHTLLILFSQFTGLIYTIDAGNIYHRSAAYPLAYLMPAAIMLFSAFLLVRYRRQLSQAALITFWLFLLVPAAAMVVQLFLYGVYIVLFSVIFTALVLYFYIIADQAEQNEKQAKELKELKVSILTQQIQPHFIYNTMNTAYLLSNKDPEQARDLIRDFTAYLKSNIGALSTPKAIPFTEELEATRAYLGILLKRFPGRFSVEYRLDCTDFTLPALSLQPIAENAVKYGVLQSDEPDRLILISSEETPDGYALTVRDNGPGFDTAAAPSGESTHIGLGNVRERLQYICRGTLEVRSVPGEGTTVTIRIPH